MITRKSILVLCSMLLAISSFAQSAKELKKEREKIAKQGIKVRKEILYIYDDCKKVLKETRTYKYDENGNNVEYVWCNLGRKWSEKETFKYNENGNLIEEISYNTDEKNEKLAGKITYEYDKNESRSSWYYDVDGKLWGKAICKYIYDDMGNLIEKECNSNEKFTHKYDEKGNEIEWDRYYTGKLEEKEVYKYDINGNKIERAEYNADGKFVGKDIYKYDKNGNLIRELSYRADDILLFKRTYKYDANGNVIRETNYDIEDGKEIPQSQTVYEYTFYDQSKEQKEKSKDTVKNKRFEGYGVGAIIFQYVYRHNRESWECSGVGGAQ